MRPAEAADQPMHEEGSSSTDAAMTVGAHHRKPRVSVISFSAGGIRLSDQLDEFPSDKAAAFKRPNLFSDSAASLSESLCWEVCLLSSARRDADVAVVDPLALIVEDNCYDGGTARACRGMGVYGVPGLPADVKASVAIKTILWKRADEFITCMSDHDIPWILVVPSRGVLHQCLRTSKK